jgi:hypothetical protein
LAAISLCADKLGASIFEYLSMNAHRLLLLVALAPSLAWAQAADRYSGLAYQRQADGAIRIDLPASAALGSTVAAGKSAAAWRQIGIDPALLQRAPTATITVNFGSDPAFDTGNPVGLQRRAAFEAAAAIYARLLVSNQPITVNAFFQASTNNFPCAFDAGSPQPVVSAGSPQSFVIGPSGAAFNDTAYPVALAEAISGQNLNGSEREMDARLNSRVDSSGCVPGITAGWSYVTDAATPIPSNQLSAVAAVLREMTKGLGYFTYTCILASGCGTAFGLPIPQGGLIPIGTNIGGTQLEYAPDIFVRQLRDRTVGGGLDWVAMTPAQRATSMANDPNLIWNGAFVTAALAIWQPTGPALNAGRLRTPPAPSTASAPLSTSATTPVPTC